MIWSARTPALTWGDPRPAPPFESYTPVESRVCPDCKAEITKVRIRDGKLWYFYPCLCANDPAEHWLTRVWQGIDLEDG